MKQARFWEKAEEDKVRCFLCAHRCLIAHGKTGACGVRKNEHGELYSLVWGKSISAHVDPIEKKPLFHFLPGSRSFSIATLGCNFTCSFCQNSDISQLSNEKPCIPGEDFLPEAVVAAAIRNDCRSISYTYTEPTIYLEYALDTAVLAKEQGLFNVMVTNGYTTTSVIEHNFKGTIHAANIDLKAFTERFYKKLCSARLAPVLDAIKAYHDAGIWIEITTLIIPSENDSDEELHDIASFINSISPSIPWHISRYHPSYRYDLAPPTPVTTIERAREIGLSEGLHFVYSGNVRGHVGENTCCPNCKKLIIARKGFSIERLDMKGQACGCCNHTIPGRFN